VVYLRIVHVVNNDRQGLRDSKRGTAEEDEFSSRQKRGVNARGCNDEQGTQVRNNSFILIPGSKRGSLPMIRGGKGAKAKTGRAKSKPKEERKSTNSPGTVAT